MTLDARLEENLRTLVPAAAGDWNDVVSRARRLGESRSRRRRRLALAFTVLALVLCTGTALAIGNQLFGWFTVSTTSEQAPTLPGAAPYVAGRTLYLAGRESQPLAAPLLAPLLGQDAAIVVASPGGRYVAYHSWRHDVPLLFVHDTVTGHDRLLARGAQTIAWGGDGRIAYVESDPPRYRGAHAYLGRVMVQTLGGKPVAWTARAGTYGVLGWARRRLLVAVRGCLVPDCPTTEPEPGVYALTPTGRLVGLPLATVAALSPDGRLAIGRYDPTPGQDSPSPLVRLVETTTGHVLATLDLFRTAREAGLRGLIPGTLQTAAWRGKEIVGTFSGQDSALVFLRVRARRLTVEGSVRIPATTLPGRYGISFGPPSFTGEGTRRVVVAVRASTADDRFLAAVLACDRRTRHCVRGQKLAAREWFAVVTNPSRPLASRLLMVRRR